MGRNPGRNCLGWASQRVSLVEPVCSCVYITGALDCARRDRAVSQGKLKMRSARAPRGETLGSSAARRKFAGNSTESLQDNPEIQARVPAGSVCKGVSLGRSEAWPHARGATRAALPRQRRFLRPTSANLALWGRRRSSGWARKITGKRRGSRPGGGRRPLSASEKISSKAPRPREEKEGPDLRRSYSGYGGTRAGQQTRQPQLANLGQAGEPEKH